MYNSREPIIIYPGCVTFTHNSFFDYVDFIRKQFSKDTIRVYIFTWDEQFNNDYALELKDRLNKTSFIDPVFIQEPYNSPNFINFLTSINSDVDLTFTPFIKKFIIFYTISRLVEEISNYNKHSIIFKVRSGYDFRTYNYDNNLLQDIDFNYNDLKFYINKNTFTKVAKEDVFWCNRMNAHGISEVMWNSSYSTVSKVFGPSTKELSKKFRTIVEKYTILYPNKDLQSLFLEDFFPHSGPHMVKELFDLSIRDYICSVLPLYLHYTFSLGPVNPLVYFVKEDGEYVTKVNNKRTIPDKNKKNLILPPNKEDIRAKRFV